MAIKGLSMLETAHVAPAAAPAAAPAVQLRLQPDGSTATSKAAEVVDGEQASTRLDRGVVAPSTKVLSTEATRAGVQETLDAVVRMQEALFLSMQSQGQSLLNMGAMQRQMHREMQSMRKVQSQSTPNSHNSPPGSRNLREARAMGSRVFA